MAATWGRGYRPFAGRSVDSGAPAGLRVDGDDLLPHLHAVEMGEGMHGDIRVPRRAVTHVRAVDTAWPHPRGTRAPGTDGPGVVVVVLAGGEYGRLIVTMDHAAAVAARIREALPEG